MEVARICASSGAVVVGDVGVGAVNQAAQAAGIVNAQTVLAGAVGAYAVVALEGKTNRVDKLVAVLAGWVRGMRRKTIPCRLAGVEGGWFRVEARRWRRQFLAQQALAHKLAAFDGRGLVELGVAGEHCGHIQYTAAQVAGVNFRKAVARPAQAVNCARVELA